MLSFPSVVAKEVAKEGEEGSFSIHKKILSKDYKWKVSTSEKMFEGIVCEFLSRMTLAT